MLVISTKPKQRTHAKNLINYQVVQGQQTISGDTFGNNPDDDSSDFLQFEGSENNGSLGTVSEQSAEFLGGVGDFLRQTQKNIADRRKTRVDAKAQKNISKGIAKELKQGAKQTQAEAQVEAAKGLSQQAATQDYTPIPEPVSSQGIGTGTKVIIAVVVVGALALVGFLVMKGKK